MRILQIINGGEYLYTVQTITERKFLFIKLKPLIRTFITNRKIVNGYYEWLESPDFTLVDGHLSFQLDAWVKYFNK